MKYGTAILSTKHFSLTPIWLKLSFQISSITLFFPKFFQEFIADESNF